MDVYIHWSSSKNAYQFFTKLFYLQVRINSNGFNGLSDYLRRRSLPWSLSRDRDRRFSAKSANKKHIVAFSNKLTKQFKI